MNPLSLKHLESFSPSHYSYDCSDQLRLHVYNRSTAAFVAGDSARDAIRTPAALRARQQFIRRTFIAGLGGLPQGGPLNARTVGIVHGQGFRIEKVIFESRPKHFVTANLYLPEQITGRRGAVLFVCGHHARAKHADEYQTVCQTLVQAGLVVLAQDPIGQGERYSYHDPKTGKQTVGYCCPEHDFAGIQSIPLGQTIGRYFLHDSMRAVDYLLSRPEVDPKRIGVTGNSGGGTQTSMMMLADTRIAAAAPATFIMNRESYMWSGQAQDAEQIWPGFTAAGLDHEDILLAMCPKPVRVLAVTWDFFPIEGTRRTVARCKRIWKLAGKPNQVDLFEDDSLHKYTVPMAHAAAEFFSRHLLGRELDGKELPVSLFAQEKLWCTKSGQIQGEIRGAKFAHEACVDELKTIVRPKKNVKQGLSWLQTKVLANRKSCDLNPRFTLDMESAHDLAIDRAWWWSQENVINAGMVFRPANVQSKKFPVTMALWEGGCTQLETHNKWIREQCGRGRAVFVIEPTAFGSIAARPLTQTPPQNFYGVNHKLSDDLFWLNDSLAAMRVWDVLRAMDVAALWPRLDAGDMRAYAHGRHGLYLQLAANLDARIKGIEVRESLGSFASLIKTRLYDANDVKTVMIPGVLHHFDLPEIRST